jgi:Zn finger protein HypA/HybF involved in hydrogenase expression
MKYVVVRCLECKHEWKVMLPIMLDGYWSCPKCDSRDVQLINFEGDEK